MRIKDAFQVANHLLDVNIPVMLWGSPGIGKSDVARQLAVHRNMKIEDVRLSQMDPVDMRGVPFVETWRDGKVTKWAIADFFTRLHMEPTILFFDEINSAAQATQAAAYQIILDRMLGDFRLPEHTRLLAAGNNIGDGAIVNQMSTALRNRFAHIDVEEHLDDWCKWAAEIGKVPSEIIGCLRFRTSLLNEGSKKEARNNKVFATPRGWERVGKLMGRNLPESTEFYAYSAIVGEGAAIEFRGYLKYHRDIPDMEKLLKDPKGYKLPDEPAMQYALSAKLAEYATVKNFDKVVQVAARLPAEFQVIMMIDAVRRTQTLTGTPQFTAWVAQNSEVVF